MQPVASITFAASVPRAPGTVDRRDLLAADGDVESARPPSASTTVPPRTRRSYVISPSSTFEAAPSFASICAIASSVETTAP